MADSTNTSSNVVRRIGPAHSRAASRRTAGFSLVELMIGVAIGTMILLAIVTTYICSVRAFQAVANYAEIHTDGRKTVDVFIRDMRAVSAITAYTSSSGMTVTIPTSFSWSGTVTTSKTVSYSYSNGALYRYDSSTGTTDMTATNVYAMVLTLFDRIGNSTTVIADAKSVQVDIRLRKYVLSQVQSEDYVSARTTMRNIP